MTTLDPGVSARYGQYLAALSTLREPRVLALVHDALDAGTPVEAVLLDLIAPAQAEVGRRWARNEWTVAQEHAATAISERAMAAAGTRIDVPASAGSLVVCCAEGEWHGLPARLFAEIARTRGWDVTFLGASLPADHLASFLTETGPDAVAVSCSLATSLPQARVAIEAVRSQGIPVLAGGAGFGPDDRYARYLGATGWAPDARSGMTSLAELPGVVRPAPPLDAGAEWRELLERRDALVELAWERLAGEWPAIAAYPPTHRRHAVDDLGRILDHAAMAQFVRDDELFARFLRWTRDVLGARSVPPPVLNAGLSALAEVAEDLPESRRVLGAGLLALA
ncbi:B12-binding domain-containing protein [Saccharopolyspora sp. MS10]|uniref:cobalamin B12-binding domain-containing protein n=1 Tax=Saccharopolyspora sp. MS10 TaxID=3385973 RepID=UPI0039A3091B